MPHITGNTHAQCKSGDQQSREGVKGREKQEGEGHWSKRTERRRKEEEKKEGMKDGEETEAEEEGEKEEEKGRRTRRKERESEGTGGEKRNGMGDKKGEGEEVKGGEKEVEADEPTPHFQMSSLCTLAKFRINISLIEQLCAPPWSSSG